ncbi:hypothetical protein HOL24_00165 [bacterium]|jgi:hypothetical protein|nr:hypothetical protein [bacterium]
MNKRRPNIFVLCYPHLGILDNWLPVVDMMNSTENHLNFTLIIPNATIIKSFHEDNAVVKISNNLFSTVLVHAHDNIWIKNTSVFNTVKWYRKNRTVLRLFDILKRLIKKKLFSYVLMYPLILLRNKIYKKEFRFEYRELNGFISQTDILLYDIYTEDNYKVSDILQLFENNKKYGLPHAISMAAIEQKAPALVNVHNKNNIVFYIYTKLQREHFKVRYGLNINKIRIVGVPRHNHKWIKKIQEKSPKLPDNFDSNTIVILSRHVDGHLSFDEKVETLKNIKKMFVDRLDMKVAIKLHPNEKQERIYKSKAERIYENIFGLSNYGVTWIYSDLHIFSLSQGKKLIVSLFTGVVFDTIAVGIPCIEYVDLSVKINNSEKHRKKTRQFVRYGFVEGVSSYHDLRAFVEKWISDPDAILATSMNAYNFYFPLFDDIPRVMATEILQDNKITD